MRAHTLNFLLAGNNNGDIRDSENVISLNFCSFKLNHDSPDPCRLIHQNLKNFPRVQLFGKQQFTEAIFLKSFTLWFFVLNKVHRKKCFSEAKA